VGCIIQEETAMTITTPELTSTSTPKPMQSTLSDSEEPAADTLSIEIAFTVAGFFTLDVMRVRFE